MHNYADLNNNGNNNTVNNHLSPVNSVDQLLIGSPRCVTFAGPTTTTTVTTPQLADGHSLEEHLASTSSTVLPSLLDSSNEQQLLSSATLHTSNGPGTEPNQDHSSPSYLMLNENEPIESKPLITQLSPLHGDQLICDSPKIKVESLHSIEYFS